MVTKIKLSRALLYLTPMILFIGVFFVLPLFFTVPVSLFHWDGIDSMKYIGVQNFLDLWQDLNFKTALVNSIYWILAATFLHTLLGLLIALVLNRKPRGWRFFRTVFFLPNILSITSLALLWYFLLNPSFGLVNNLLRVIGLDNLILPWLSNPDTALVATQLPFILYIGFTMLIFLANMMTIAPEYYEAGEMDGASVWQRELYITIPLIRRSIAINILFNIAFTLKMVEYPLIMTGGGPAGLTFTLPLYIYQQMVIAHSYGRTMAAGLVTFVIGLAATLIIFIGLHIFDRKWE
jgi:raffinose/stachyose/melibiose transport system permease protein